MHPKDTHQSSKQKSANFVSGFWGKTRVIDLGSIPQITNPISPIRQSKAKKFPFAKERSEERWKNTERNKRAPNAQHVKVVTQYN